MGNCTAKRLQITNRAPMEVYVTVVGLTGERKNMGVCVKMKQLQKITVLQLKEKIKQQFGLPHLDVEHFRLAFNDELLGDDQYLSDCGVQHGSTLNMVLRLGAAERPQSTDGPQTGVHVNVVGLTGEIKEVKVCETEEQLQSITVLQLLEKIKQQFDLPRPGFVWLIFENKKLRHHLCLSHYGIQHGSVIHIDEDLKSRIACSLPVRYYDRDRDDHRRSMLQLGDFHSDGSGAAGDPCYEDQ